MTTPPFPATPDGPALYAVAVPALALAALLIGAFAWGSHHLNRRRPKPARDTPASPAAPATRAGSRHARHASGPDGPHACRRKPAGRETGRPSHRRAHRAAPPRRSS
ncbi:hypothetical protein ACFWJ4_40290 [Kitasatospora sp. NPDC127067]|uniref:hypothetical protein n=1 Tax=Kitasatospora sp. NPDC127067 TaxID=3347126 RepID=UPI00366894D4